MNMNVGSEESQLLSEQKGALGVITLNRPKALNSLTPAMIRAMESALDRYEHEPDVAAVIVLGAGERGFCAGGDIRMIVESGKAGNSDAATFWFEEYRLNSRISHYPKPYIAIMDGITMGGGVGLSAHGSHRIVTDRLRLAMPETGIGFFPDVGATWLLARAPGEIGTYLGLTGDIIGAADAIHAGLADVHVPAEQLPALYEALSSLSSQADAGRISETIARHAQNPEPGRLAPAQGLIDRCFAFDDVEAIFEALAADGSDFALHALKTMQSKSPTSLKIALGLLREARESESLEECLDREYAGSMEILKLDDFYEGVRAAVIDKDRQPKWQPATLDGVTAQSIARFFVPHDNPPFGRR